MVGILVPCLRREYARSLFSSHSLKKHYHHASKFPDSSNLPSHCPFFTIHCLSFKFGRPLDLTINRQDMNAKSAFVSFWRYCDIGNAKRIYRLCSSVPATAVIDDTKTTKRQHLHSLRRECGPVWTLGLRDNLILVISSLYLADLQQPGLVV